MRAALRSLRTAKRKVDSREDHVPRFLWLLLPALALLAYDTWLLTRRRAANDTDTGTTIDVSGLGMPSATLVLLFATLPLSAVSCKQPPDPAALFAAGNVAAAIAAYRAQIATGDTTVRTRYNLGTALIGADSVNAAAELLEMVRRESAGETRMRARFNAGYASLVMGRTPQSPDADAAFAAARAAYRAFLTDRPVDADAKWNYELALRKPPPPQSGGGGAGGDAKNDKQNEQPQNEGGLDQRQAEALLNSAAREERDVQGRKQRQGRTPPGGKDW